MPNRINRAKAAEASNVSSVRVSKNGHTSSRSAGRQLASGAIPWNEYHVADARNVATLLGKQPVVDVTVTSPPYWDVKDYGSENQIGFRQKLDEYLNDLVKVFTDIWKCTKPNGSLWIVINSIKKDGRLHLLPFMLAERLTNLPQHTWYLQDELIWHKTHTFPWVHRQKLNDTFEHILCFSKSKTFSLNSDAVRSTAGITSWWVKYPERYNPLGKTLGNVWEIPIPTQGSWGNGHFAHACPLPLELIKRIVLMSSGPDGTVLDPFGGTGSTALAAHELGRKWIVLDLNHEYRDMFHRRLAHEAADPTQGIKRKTSDIAQTNLSLRQLKYGLLIYKRIAPGLRLTSKDVPLIFIQAGTKQRTPKPHWVKGTKIHIVLNDECFKKRAAEIESDVVDQLNVAPLSKFQLDVSVIVTSRTKFMRFKRDVKVIKTYGYPRGEFWKSAGPVDLAAVDAKEQGKFPLIISDILVHEQPAF